MLDMLRDLVAHKGHANAAVLGAAFVLIPVMLVSACDNGSSTPVPTPTVPSAPTAPAVSVQSVTPSVGATTGFTIKFALTAGTACGQGLLGGVALTLDDNTILDSVDANGSSGFPPLNVDQNCTGPGTSTVGFPQRLAALPNVLHVVAVTLYLSPPSTAAHAPSFGSAVASARSTTDLYTVAQPVGVDVSPASVRGTWTGPMQDGTGGAGTLTLSLVQFPNATEVFGTWSFAFAHTSANTNGSVTGAVFGSAMTLFLTPSNASCPVVLRMNASGGTATYLPASGCLLPNAGSATLAQQ